MCVCLFVRSNVWLLVCDALFCVCCLLFAVRRLPFVVCRMFAVFVVCVRLLARVFAWSLSVVCVPLSDVRCLLRVDCWLVSAVCC